MENTFSKSISRRKVLTMSAVGAAGMALSSSPAARAAQAPGQRKSLPRPEMDGGISLLAALAARRSNRSIDPNKAVSEQHLSNLLWATWGESSPKGLRTAPSAMNKQEGILYVVLDDGVWQYDAVAKDLVLALAGDQRGLFGGSPVTLLYAGLPQEFSYMLVGSMYQNSGLYLASVGLAGVVKAQKRDALDGKLALPAGYKILINMPVGWPA